MAEKVPIREGAFIEGPDGGRLLANKCKFCGQVFFPKASTCMACYHDQMEEVLLSRRGKLYTYTVGHMPSSHFMPPYAVGYVDLPEGVRVFAPLKMLEDTPFKTGMDMEVVIEGLWREGDTEVWGYKFMPVKGGGP